MSCSSDFEDKPFVFLSEDFGFENGESFPKEVRHYSNLLFLAKLFLLS